jgi:hypothetical protein
MDADEKGFTVALKLDPNNIKFPYSSIKSGKRSPAITNIVMYNTWVLGQHGGKLPYDIIPEANRIPPSAIGENWRCLVTTGWTWQPPRMEVSPMQMMDAWFKSYATEENLNRLTQNIVTASINRYLMRYDKRYGNK